MTCLVVGDVNLLYHGCNLQQLPRQSLVVIYSKKSNCHKSVADHIIFRPRNEKSPANVAHGQNFRCPTVGVQALTKERPTC
jgi:hypothetical protein